MIIRTFRPGKIHNLYDSKRHGKLAGVLVFNFDEQKKSSSLKKVSDQKNIEKKVNDKLPTTTVEIISSSLFSDKFLQFAFKVDAVVMRCVKKINYTSEFRTSLISFICKFRNTNKLLINFALTRMYLAIILLLISLGSIGLLVSPLVIAQLGSAIDTKSLINISPTQSPFAYDYYYQPSKDSLYPITEFRIEIPKIKLESNIVNNVDTNIEGEYKDKLQFGVAHAKGSYLPPENGGPVYLFAHSTDTIFNIARFNAKFFSVRELEEGDEIKVYFNNKEYDYSVKEKFVINPYEIDVIRNANTDLILQTCWPPGTDWQRLIVLADRKEASTSSVIRSI